MSGELLSCVPVLYKYLLQKMEFLDEPAQSF